MPWYPFSLPQVHLSCSVLLCPSTTNFLMTSKYMQFPMTQISYCLRCQSSSSPALPFLVLLQAAVPLWCPSKFLDDADQASYHLLSCLYSVLPWTAFPLPSPCDFQVHFFMTQIPDTCPVLLLSPCRAATAAVMYHAAKKPSYFQVTWHQFNAM